MASSLPVLIYPSKCHFYLTVRQCFEFENEKLVSFAQKFNIFIHQKLLLLLFGPKRRNHFHYRVFLSTEKFEFSFHENHRFINVVKNLSCLIQCILCLGKYEVCSKSNANFGLIPQLFIFSSILILSHLKYSLFDIMHF